PFSMFRNHLALALRNLFLQKGHSTINILGLAVGLACSLLIFLWVAEERAVDQHFASIDRIYQVTQLHRYPNGQTTLTEAVQSPAIPMLATNYADIQRSSRATYEQRQRVLV